MCVSRNKEGGANLLEFYQITEERYNTLRNAGIEDHEMDAYIRVGLDLNGNTIYKVKHLLTLEKKRKCGSLWYCCCFYGDS
jgi:hypothetical protein